MRKEKKTYYFSVEGDTEAWYLEWLQKTINEDPQARYTVKLEKKVEKDPQAQVKRMTVMGKTDIVHFFDYESNDEEHVRRFRTTLDNMKKAQSMGKNIRYHLGYSNFTFDLWMILHKQECTGSLTHRNQYLDRINRAYEEHFGSMDEYKRENNFKRILSKLTLDNVRSAIRRAKIIMQENERNGFVLQRYKCFEYYRENPSLSVWESIERILEDCCLA